jgi:hypothetical protein
LAILAVTKVVDDTGVTSSPAFWTALIGGVTGAFGVILGRKSRPLDKADTAARIGDAWDRIAVQLTTDNALLRTELADLKASEAECKDKLDALERAAHANEMRHDHLVGYLNKLGLDIPQDDMPSGDA